jgi:hypothetical protein
MNENFFGERLVSSDGKTVVKRKAGFEQLASKEIPKAGSDEEAMKNKLREEIKKFRENKPNSN